MSRTMKSVCSECGKEYEIMIKEYTRHTKAGRHTFFCTRSCAAVHRNKNLPPEERTRITNMNLSPQWKNPPIRRKGNFTYFIRRAKSRSYECNLTEQGLNVIWERQQGRCALTGVQLQLPVDTTNSTKVNSPTAASLDRIDSDQGYTLNNVQFLARAINLAKNSHTNDVMKSFIEAIRRS